MPTQLDLIGVLNNLGLPSSDLVVIHADDANLCYGIEILAVKAQSLWLSAGEQLTKLGWSPVLLDSLVIAREFTELSANVAPVPGSRESESSPNSVPVSPSPELKNYAEQGLQLTETKEFQDMLSSQIQQLSGGLDLSEEQIQRMHQQQVDSQKDTFNFLARFDPGAIHSSLSRLDAFQNPGDSLKVANDFITFGEKLEFAKWAEQKIASDPEYFLVDEAPWSDTEEKLEIISCIVANKVKTKALLLFVPTGESWKIPAILHFGGWNDCPPPQIQVAVLKHWHDNHGARLMAIGRDCIDLWIDRPISTKSEAFRVAKEQFIYCGDLVHSGDGTLSRPAAQILGSKIWSFWWD